MVSKSNDTGFPCPHCGAATYVRDSRRNPLGIRRRRSCRTDGCESRFTTHEVVAHDKDSDLRVQTHIENGGTVVLSVAGARMMTMTPRLDRHEAAKAVACLDPWRGFDD